MATKRVIVELRHSTNLAAAAMAGSTGPASSLQLPGFVLDTGFAPVPLPGLLVRSHSGDPRDTGSLHALATAPEDGTYLVRGEIKEGSDAGLAAAQGGNVVGVFADAVVEPMLICPGSAALGTAADVERLLGVPAMRRCGMDGNGVLVAIVDGGVNVANLNAHGKTPVFDAARSFSTVPGQVPGSATVGHGTMCAFDACIAAPRCTLLDIAVLRSFDGTPSGFGALLSDIIRAYAHLQGVLAAPRRPGDLRSLVVSNSWGMFTDVWDFPRGDPRNYGSNPNHPMNRAVAALEAAGADILFAAGNCGADCPDGRCAGVTANTISGANSHPAVLSVAGVDTARQRVGYSAMGPGRLTANKPDIAGYTHFQGSGVYAADGGTSAACPVVAGVVAAVRSVRPLDPVNPGTLPAAIRTFITSTAIDLGASGYDFATGFGVVSGEALAKRICLTVPPGGDICRRFPWICEPLVPWDLCRRFPHLCGRIPFPIPRHPFPPGPFPPGPTPPGPMQAAPVGTAEAEGEAAEGLPDDIAVAYMQGVLHGRQLGDAAAPDPAPRHGGGCGCGKG